MADGIRIGNYSVSSFKVGVDDCSIYLGDVKLYPQGGYDLCYDVVDDISDYQGSFADVFEKSTETWYKLNNLGEYEEYGVYGEGMNITTYKGKLTIDGGHEYEWNGSSWVDLGEASGSTVTIKSPEYIERGDGFAGQIDLGVVLKDNTKFQIKINPTRARGSFIIGEKNSPGDIDDYRFFWYNNTLYYDYGSDRINTSKDLNTIYEYEIGNYYVKDMVTSATVLTSTTKSGVAESHQRNICLGAGTKDYWQAYYLKVYEGETLIRDFIPWTDMLGNYGLFDKVSMQVFEPTGGRLTASSVVNDVVIGELDYPKYYSDKADPLDNLTFNTLAEAETYAMSNCVYDGMKSTIGGSKYVFDSVNGWTLIPEYYKVEDVTPSSQGGSGWTITGSATYNPDLTYYDDFDIETNSTTSQWHVAKVTIYGYEHFTYYLRTYDGYSSAYAFLTATNVDELQSDPTSLISYDSSSAITNTFNFLRAAGSAVNLSNYRRVTYNNLDKTVEHTFYVIFNGRTYSNYVGNATILIPKEQTNENFEQVTFSASTNVAPASKNLYIDGNNSTSGGTSSFYYRWIVGLPAGSHTSYTDYSNLSYCPTTSSATFTSVAGNSRQVDYIYQTNPTTGIIVRLVDGDGNVLTPPVNSVSYNVYKYNPCGTSTFTSYYLPGTVTGLYVGGIFKFGYYNNQQYIYGYQPPSVGTTYNVDDYNTFDLVYTELDKEAVTITYTTYDPNDAETPTFNTDVTWPYSGGTTSSTTLTSFDVPYTYEYTVDQTSNLFSANTQNYTAGQASRTITFLLYPNNREFQTVADMEAYQYAWEGMRAKVGSTKYKYENGQWIEITSKEDEFVIGDFSHLITDINDVTEGYYIIYSSHYSNDWADKSHLVSWNSGNTYNGNYTLGNMTHQESSASTPISSNEIIDDAVWQLISAGNGNFYIKNVATGLYWSYIGRDANEGTPLTQESEKIEVNIPEYFTLASSLSGVAFVEKQTRNNYAINRLYAYCYRYGWYNTNYKQSDGNNCYTMRKYIPQ